jgi:pimeloyl-ACP methyl ester carboxylesterase
MSKTGSAPAGAGATPGSLLDALPYTDRGRGQPLVMLHGFPLDRRMWDAQVERLSDHYRVIAPDLRGFGRSARSDPFTIESLADDIHLFVEQLVAVPCVLAGLSMGGYVALAHAKKYQSDLRGLIMVDTKAAGDTQEGKQGRQRMIELVRLSGAKAVAEQMLPKMLAPGTLQSRPDVVKSMRSMMEACPPHTIEYALSAMRDRPDRTGELPGIEVPTLVIVGDADAITPPDVAEGMAKAIPGAKLETIRGAGHMAPMEQPEQVNRAIERFMSGL